MQNKKGELEVTIFIIENEPVHISNIEVLVDSLSFLQDVLKKKEIKNLELKNEAFIGKVFRDEAINHDQKLLAEVFYDKGYAYTAKSGETGHLIPGQSGQIYRLKVVSHSGSNWSGNPAESGHLKT